MATLRIIKKSTFFLLLIIILACKSNNEELSVLQFNIWQEGTEVENGFNAIVENIIKVDPSMVTFSEVRNYNSVDFIKQLISELAHRGVIYYGEYSESTGIISKYPILQQKYIYPLESDHGSILKGVIKVKDKTIILYSAHLDYRDYACYLPRGYSGSSWQKLDEAITKPELILKASRKSKRLEAIEELMIDAEKEIQQKHIVIIGGDFNEPSHLDWQEDTKNLWEHNGSVVNWDCSKALYEKGFIDTYRKCYPNPVSHPGFTFPSDNPDVAVSKLTWAPDADERERIDFIYYYPSENIVLKDVVIVGPSSSIVRSKREEEQSSDNFISSEGTWPTDHKAVLSKFLLK